MCGCSRSIVHDFQPTIHPCNSEHDLPLRLLDRRLGQKVAGICRKQESNETNNNSAIIIAIDRDEARNPPNDFVAPTATTNSARLKYHQNLTSHVHPLGRPLLEIKLNITPKGQFVSKPSLDQASDARGTEV